MSKKTCSDKGTSIPMEEVCPFCGNNVMWYEIACGGCGVEKIEWAENEKVIFQMKDDAEKILPQSPEFEEELAKIEGNLLWPKILQTGKFFEIKELIFQIIDQKKAQNTEYLKSISQKRKKKENQKLRGKAALKVFTAIFVLCLFACGTLYGIYAIKPTIIFGNCQIAYHVDENSTENVTIPVIYGKSYSIEIPKRAGYVFKGLYDSEENGTQFVTADGNSIKRWDVLSREASLTLYAQWEVIRYSIEFNANGGSVVPQEGIYCVYGDNMLEVFNVASRAGYTFVGWGDSSGNILYTDSLGNVIENKKELVSSEYAIPQSGDVIEMCAIWEVNVYSVKYETNEGVVTSDKSNIQYGSNYSLLIPTKKGHGFVGWYFDANFEKQVTDEYGKSLYNWDLLKEITVYAKWIDHYIIDISSNFSEMLSAGIANKKFNTFMKVTIDVSNLDKKSADADMRLQIPANIKVLIIQNKSSTNKTLEKFSLVIKDRGVNNPISIIINNVNINSYKSNVLLSEKLNDINLCLESSVVLQSGDGYNAIKAGNVNLTCNGAAKIVGGGGVASTTDGCDALSLSKNCDIKVVGSLSLIGGNGCGYVSGVRGSDGGNGIGCIDVFVTGTGTLAIIGGNGGEGRRGGNGGNGGKGIFCNSIQVNVTSLINIKGGNGGDGGDGEYGYNGRDGENGVGAWDTGTDGRSGSVGGNGDCGGSGGDAGLAIDAKKLNIVSGTVKAACGVAGNGGSGGAGGNGGRGGNGGICELYYWIVDDSRQRGINAGDGAIGGNGGDGGNSGKNLSSAWNNNMVCDSIGTNMLISVQAQKAIAGKGGNAGSNGRGGNPGYRRCMLLFGGWSDMIFGRTGTTPSDVRQKGIDGIVR